MSAFLFESAIILLLIVANGVFALSEIAVVSSRKARLQEKADKGSKSARAALELAESPNRFLSTVQIGITLIGILAGTMGGATLARHIAGWLEEVPTLAPYSQALSVAIVVAAITYLSLIIGELVPKRVGLNNPEGIASAVARPMKRLAWLASPLVWLLEKSSDAVMWALRIRQSDEPPVTEEEVKVMLDLGTAAGVFHPDERGMIRRVFRLADRHVDEVMTPRTQIDWLDLDEPPEVMYARIRENPRSRYPIARGELEEVVGVVEAKQLLGECLGGGTVGLEAKAVKPFFVPDTMKALALLKEFKKSATHTALVVDEYGAILGLVTPGDIFEAIAGDFPGAEGLDGGMAVQRADGSWLLDGMLPIYEVKETLGIAALPDEDTEAFSTLGGFVVFELGRVPAAADSFERDGYRYEVVDMDGRRVDKVLAVRIAGAM